MKALIVDNGVLSISDGALIPTPTAGEVLVKVMSSGVNPSDVDMVAGVYDDLIPIKEQIGARTGFEFAGIVATDGNYFKKGDRVYGYIDFLKDVDWAHQEYVCISEQAIGSMPATLSFDEASTVPVAAQTTLSALRDVAKAQAGENLLVIGAGGGLGPFAIQIGKILDMGVAAVAGAGAEDTLKEIGADAVYDYHQTDLTDIEGHFDVILDLSTNYKYREIAHLLTENGRFLPAHHLKNAEDFAEGTESSLKTKELFIVVGVKEDLEQVAAWIDAGAAKTVVDSTFVFSDFQEAFDRVADKGKKGRVVLRISEESRV